MAKTQWTLLFSTFIISCMSMAFIIVSFATNYWISAEAKVNGSVSNSEINYGLFSGSLTRHLLESGIQYDLKIICLYDENVCIYSCQQTSELREIELKNIIKGIALTECGTSPRHKIYENIPKNGISYGFSNKSILKQMNQENVTKKCIDTGVWLSTVVFLGIAAIFAFISALFAVINILFNPIEPIFSILGLYIWNGISAGASLTALIIWGTVYTLALAENIAITDTLRVGYQSVSANLAMLGYSYWLVICPVIFHLVNIVLLLWRGHVIGREPKISAEATLIAAQSNSYINYGLFSGTLERHVVETGAFYDLQITCLYEESACIYSCQDTVEKREDELRRIIANILLLSCPNSNNNRHYKTRNILNLKDVNDMSKQSEGSIDKRYIKPGLWISTILFLTIAIIFAFLSALFAIINIIYNPVNPIFSILGLYIWNGIASGSAFITLVIWGALYSTTLIQNVAITDTLRSEYVSISNNLAYLGFSYWLMLCPMILHIINIALVLWRSHIIGVEPKAPTITVEKNDNTILLY